LFIKNARLGDEKEAQKSLELIKRHRVIAVEGEDVDAKFLTNPLNQADIQHLADDFKKEIHYITHIPDFTSNDFTQNASDPILKAKTKPLLDLCLTKEKWFNKGYMIALKLTLDFVKDNDTRLYNKIKFDLDGIDLVYTHSLPSNDGDMVRNIVNLANVGQLAPRIALQGLSFIPNVDAYLKEVKEYNEYVDKRKSANNNKNETNGLNDTNLERQNATPKDKDQEDNFKNYVEGEAKELSPNKV
jgi:SPP1 family phage portal protein